LNGTNGFTAPFGDSGAFVAAALDAAGADLSVIREEARASARKVRWKKVVKRFENQLEALVSPEVAESTPVPAS
jgi:hypothetical protein